MRRGSPLLPADSVDWSALIPSATTSRCWWKASDEWPGAFGFVTLAVRPGAFAGSDVWYVRTDTSDAGFAEAEHLVHVPKLAPLTGEGLSGAAYVVEGGPDDQPTVFSTEPGRDDYTPAWTLRRVMVGRALRTALGAGDPRRRGRRRAGGRAHRHRDQRRDRQVVQRRDGGRQRPRGLPRRWPAPRTRRHDRHAGHVQARPVLPGQPLLRARPL